ncbi:MAG: hypothetical protein WAZ36_07915 [Sediminibacterium sp.]
MKELVEYILQFGNLNKQQIDLINVYYDIKAAVYQSSKSALNMYAVNLAYELKDTAFKVNAIDLVIPKLISIITNAFPVSGNFNQPPTPKEETDNLTNE